MTEEQPGSDGGEGKLIVNMERISQLIDDH